MVSGLLTNTAYDYDDANRLTSVNGVTYTWDNNGNLLNDGVNTYVYDSANRLVALSNQQSAMSYGYNGLGDRLSQTVNGNTTNYTLDLNTGLTQVLNDGTNNYLYGNGRIAQTNTTTEYFLGDALGSVRQLTDTQGEITLAKSYQPYGETLASAGNGTSPFAFTGEQQDVSGLTYLRARYYSGDTGRFLTKDSWMGDYNNPLSLNRWIYTEGNPVNWIDPSGHITEREAYEANQIVQDLRTTYQVNIQVDWGWMAWNTYTYLDQPWRNVPGWYSGCIWNNGTWSMRELEDFQDAVVALSQAMGSPAKFKANLGGIEVSQEFIGDFAGKAVAHRIRYSAIHDLSLWTFIHELAHAWDGYQSWQLSTRLESFTGGYSDKAKSQALIASGQCDLYANSGVYEYKDSAGMRGRLPGCNSAGYFYGDTPKGSDWNFSRKEDFAESVTMYIMLKGPKTWNNLAQGETRRWARTDKGYENWVFYRQYFYPPGGDYTKTLRWKFISSILRYAPGPGR